MRNMDKDDVDFTKDFKMFDFMFKSISTVIGIVLCCIVAFWVMVGYGAYKAGSEISEIGLKAFIERVWEGPPKTAPAVPAKKG